MPKLAPSHPIRRYAPEHVVDKVDTIGQHIIWAGSQYKTSKRRGLQSYSITKIDGVTTTLTRRVWEWCTGEKVPKDICLVRKSSCIHERCVNPGCFTPMTHAEAGALGHTVMTKRQKARDAVS